MADLDSSIAAVTAHGGAFLRTPRAPGTSAEHPFAFILDPAGAAFAIWQSAPGAADIAFQGAYPIGGDVHNIPVKELGPAIAFYTRLLGFQLVSREDGRAVLRRDAAEIGLTRSGEDPEQVSVYFAVKGLEALHAEITTTGLEPSQIRPDKHADKDYKVFFAKEPYGVCFCFGEPAQ